MKIVSVFVVLVTLALPPSWDQGTPGRFPALLAEKPAPEHQDKLMLFGQFIGSWDFEGREVRDDGSKPTDKGEIHFQWVLQGRAVQDVWRETERSDADPKVFGTTLRFYEPKSDTWRNVWVEPVLGLTTILRGQKIGDEIVLLGSTSDGSPVRWIFSDIKPDSFHWHGEKLRGKDWSTYEELWARRRK